MSMSSPDRGTYKKNIRYYKKLVKSPTESGSGSPSKDDHFSHLLSGDKITQSQALEFEQRLTALERKIGTDKQTSQTLDERLSKVKNDLNSKLAKAASEQVKSYSIASANQENWKLIQKLLKELDPGIALTHQQQPLLYKRQQVLACSEELTTAFNELERILKLLLKGTNASSGESGSTAIVDNTSSSSTVAKSLMKTPQKLKSQDLAQQAKEKAEQKLLQKQEQQQEKSKGDATTQLRLDQVTQAPILTQHYANCEVASEQKRVQDLHLKFQALNDRTTQLQQTLRHYLECYHTTAMAVSEKIVLADERISAKLSQ